MIQALTRWWQRRTARYSIWYVDSRRSVQLTEGETYERAQEMKGRIDVQLRLMKAVAPDGPQEAKHVILPDGIEPAKGGE